jgi:hypothetical protein
MKTIKFFAIVIIALLTLNSCVTEKYYPENNWYVENFEVRARDWTPVGAVGSPGFHYEFVFDQVPLEVAYYDGIVTAYLYQTVDGAEVQTPLPFTYYEQESNVEYSIFYTYDVARDGSIAFKMYPSDFLEIVLLDESFRVAIIW